MQEGKPPGNGEEREGGKIISLEAFRRQREQQVQQAASSGSEGKAERGTVIPFPPRQEGEAGSVFWERVLQELPIDQRLRRLLKALFARWEESIARQMNEIDQDHHQGSALLEEAYRHAFYAPMGENGETVGIHLLRTIATPEGRGLLRKVVPQLARAFSKEVQEMTAVFVQEGYFPVQQEEAFGFLIEELAAQTFAAELEQRAAKGKEGGSTLLSPEELAALHTTLWHTSLAYTALHTPASMRSSAEFEPLARVLQGWITCLTSLRHGEDAGACAEAYLAIRSNLSHAAAVAAAFYAQRWKKVLWRTMEMRHAHAVWQAYESEEGEGKEEISPETSQLFAQLFLRVAASYRRHFAREDATLAVEQGVADEETLFYAAHLIQRLAREVPEWDEPYAIALEELLAGSIEEAEGALAALPPERRATFLNRVIPKAWNLLASGTLFPEIDREFAQQLAEQLEQRSRRLS